MAISTAVAAASTIFKHGGAFFFSGHYRHRISLTRRPQSFASLTTTVKLRPPLRSPLYCTFSSSAAADSSVTEATRESDTVAREDVAAVNPLKETAEATSEEVAAVDPITEAAEMLDIRVGRIMKVWRHEEADSLYVEEVDVGEEEARVICSGLVNYIPIENLQDRNVVVLANLKPRNMRGVKSCGMLMAASDASHDNVELLMPPEGSFPGERIWFGSEDDKENQPDAASPNQIQKKKIWESVQPHLKTDSSCSAVLGEKFMRTSAGVVVCSSLRNANVS